MKELENLKYTTGWIAGINRGHNAGVCLLKDGNIVYSIEEERLSRKKYDGTPFASMVKILDYTKKIDYLVIAGTAPIYGTMNVDYAGDDMYTALARKLGLIDPAYPYLEEGLMYHPQVIDLGQYHHKLHAALAFYKSGWKDCTAVVVDGAGSAFKALKNDQPVIFYETETIISCKYPTDFTTNFKHYGTNEPTETEFIVSKSTLLGEEENEHYSFLNDCAGLVKVYEAVTSFCGFNTIEAGKTMGLFPYGEPDERIPSLFNSKEKGFPISDRRWVIPSYPNSGIVNASTIFEVPKDEEEFHVMQKNMAYACQVQSQNEMLNLIKYAAKITDNNRITVSGGYGLNCVANYYYLQQLRDEGIEIYVEPVSNDSGIAMGAALLTHHAITKSTEINKSLQTLYLGGQFVLNIDDIEKELTAESETIIDASYEDVVNLLQEKNIVTIFQGKSENGPRALGNRSILFDPTFEDGKDFVNTVKNREYFRPFAGTILQEHAAEWFEMESLTESPYMMYAVACKPGKAEKIPSIIHVDGSCRIQTVTKDQNEHFYNLINEFYKKSGVPMLFNTSFNLGGEPLVETLDHAIATLRTSKIEYLYLPEISKLIIIKNE